MKTRFFLTGFAACLFVSLNAQTRLPDEIAYKIKNEAFSNSKVEETAQWITDFLGPRLAASHNGLRAETLVKNKMEEFGLSNARREFAANFPKGGWNNERTYIALTAPYYTAFAATPKAWSGSTSGLVKGEAIYLNVEKEEDLRNYKGKLGGKIVLSPVTSTYAINFEPLASRLTQERLDEIAKDPRGQQAPAFRQSRPAPNAALLQLRDKINQLLKEEKPLAVLSGNGTFNVPMSSGIQYVAGQPEPAPDITLPIEDHGRLVRLVQKDIPVELELDIKNVFSPADSLIYNVIAEIPGTDPKLKNEVVLIGAHLDSWHGGTGGADNASGCIVMLEAMRIIKATGVSPRRTIRIALWGGEEQGLYGSRGYAQNLLYDRKENIKLPDYDKFVLYLNMDNGSGRFRGIYLEENDMAVPFFKTWKEPFESLGFTTLSLRRTGSTDHVSFNTLGLPAYQFIQDGLEYGRTYHTLMDTYERLSLEDLRINAALVAWFALNAANDNARIPTKPGVLENVRNVPLIRGHQQNPVFNLSTLNPLKEGCLFATLVA
ncbi:MAG: M20/M25/M40 family metallo-hydrolase, partial [Tannerella sp.]|nr:M20/M25/M40 family metallo-hydrolase [Tannerella sp.]